MFDKIKMRRGRQWYVNKGNEWFFDEKHDKMNGKIEQIDRKSTRLNSSHIPLSRMPSSA